MERCKLLCPKKKTDLVVRVAILDTDSSVDIKQIPSSDPLRLSTPFSNQSQADKMNTEAIDTSIAPNASPSISSRLLLNRPLFSQIRTNRFRERPPKRFKGRRNQGFRESRITRRRGIKRSWFACPVN